MKKIKLIVSLIILLLPILAIAYTQVNVIGFTPFAFEQISVSSSSAKGFTSTYLTTAGAVFVTVDTYPIRYRIDGTAPTSTIGHLVSSAASQNLWFNDPASIRNFQAIGIGGTAVLNVTYYRNN